MQHNICIIPVFVFFMWLWNEYIIDLLTFHIVMKNLSWIRTASPAISQNSRYQTSSRDNSSWKYQTTPQEPQWGSSEEAKNKRIQSSKQERISKAVCSPVLLELCSALWPFGNLVAKEFWLSRPGVSAQFCISNHLLYDADAAILLTTFWVASNPSLWNQEIQNGKLFNNIIYEIIAMN